MMERDEDISPNTYHCCVILRNDNIFGLTFHEMQGVLRFQTSYVRFVSLHVSFFLLLAPAFDKFEREYLFGLFISEGIKSTYETIKTKMLSLWKITQQ